jgi:hypothetical protein
MTTLFYKIPPNLPLTLRLRSGQAPGGMVRQAHHDICHPELVEGWKRGARGDFLINVNSIITTAYFFVIPEFLNRESRVFNDFWIPGQARNDG